MKISQLSVFLENKTGVINEVTAILAKAEISMQAFSVMEGVEFGILRLIVSDIDLATRVLTEGGFKVNSTDVICINLPNTAGALSSIMECLAREEVFIQYMYAFSEGDIASTVIRPTDMDKCIRTLQSCREELLAKDPNYRF